ncbi:hypothetical protein SARC_14408 [Sphaeroforma arctica JP610]|uniref:Uncharacterized protein n=1 Tax=Sphaeroforma arctica JP610 TaxID=667725 RepID=A0A0L0F900_9EUKA|nr:hypothetical protein SARC_14408 [Sphaeroforma arctica JP610]KNC73031.1 hypothetical protein SARC_14408 [Sphaeroforma arctica JP610]|eukprot:XP_014146933.1 hypothetical protein SARC_14408 [Sphaeroforma arctica JP610]
MFYPWDYDKILRRASKHNKVSVGMSVMHDNYLFRRIMYLMPKDFTSKVTQRIKALIAESAPWSKEALEEMTDGYSKSVDPYLASGKVDNVKLNKK